MSEQIKSLWPAEIRPHILSPMIILKAQAEALVKQTGGILSADVKRKETEGGKVELTFDIVVPALNGYRHRILNVAYDMNLPYPCIVDAEFFSSGAKSVFRGFLEGRPPPDAFSNRADSDTEFIDIIAQVLQSSHILSIAQSLIARASEALAENEQLVQTVDNESLESPPADSTNETTEEI